MDIAGKISTNSLVLSSFAVLTVGICLLVFGFSHGYITQNKQQILLKTLNELIPETKYNNQLLEHTFSLQIKELGHLKPQTAYLALLDKKPKGMILPVIAPDGYGGPITLLVGVYIDGSIAGVRVLPPHKETPGLGDAIEIRKSPWIDSFRGKSLFNPTIDGWKVKKDQGEFDQFTGATITPRAIVNAVKKVLLFMQKNQNLIFSEINKEAKP